MFTVRKKICVHSISRNMTSGYTHNTFNPFSSKKKLWWKLEQILTISSLLSNSGLQPSCTEGNVTFSPLYYLFYMIILLFLHKFSSFGVHSIAPSLGNTKQFQKTRVLGLISIQKREKSILSIFIYPKPKIWGWGLHQSGSWQGYKKQN